MNRSEKREKWSRMLVQAEHFAELDNTLDAVDRAKACLREIEAARAQTKDPEARADLEQLHERAKRSCADYARKHREWLDGVREREARYRESEAEAYRSPLPVEGID